MAEKKTTVDRPSSSLLRDLGNVCNVIPLPKDFTGCVKRGHLKFDATFESGNLGRVDCVSSFEYDLHVRPDTCNSRYRMWFNFKVSNVASNQRVIFNIVNFSKTKSLYRDGMTPLVKSTSRPKWQRIPCKNVFYYRSSEQDKNYILSVAFAFDRDADTYQFAYCYPYTYTKLQTHLSHLEHLALPYFSRETIGYSVQQRRLDLVTITSPKNLGSDCEERSRVVFVTARIHPGESPSSFVCQGMMDYLVCSDPSAQVLRDNLIFKIIPMLNPDGVYLGNYRCSLMGFDLNRNWQDPSPWAHPTVIATKQLLSQYDLDPTTDLDFYIDIHSHSTLTNGFMYGNVYEDAKRQEKHTLFPKLFSNTADDFSLSQTSFNQNPSKAGTGRRFLGSNLSSDTDCYTLEVSFFGHSSVASSISVPYSEQAYLKLGQNLARTFISYYKLEDEVERRQHNLPS